MTDLLNDLAYKTFGELTVLNLPAEKRNNRKWYYPCECKCKNPNIYWVRKDNLTTGKTTTCGHTKRKFGLLKGKVFGEWTVVDNNIHIINYNPYVLCRCSCKLEKLVSRNSLYSGRSTSCGHNTTRIKDLAGQQIGEWTVKKYAYSDAIHHVTYWYCECSCGKKCAVNGYSLRTHRSMSCGHDTNSFIDLTKKQIGEWTVDSYAGIINGFAYWNCTCSCGIKRKVWSISLHNKRSVSCGHNISISNAEKDLQEFVSTFTTNFVTNDRQLLHGKELDIYLPELRLGIEYNGNYWHSTEKRDKNYHQRKTNLAQSKNINLIHIFEYEWFDFDKNLLLKDFLRNKIVGPTFKIYARQTNIKVVDYNTAKNFVDKFHLQGHIDFNIAFGLYFNNQLIQVMTFGRSKTENYDTELLRFCSNSDYLVVGGASKLFKHYIEQYPTESIISYCDISKFTGKVYEQLGMKFDDITEPKPKQIGKYKIYDCGNARYVYNN